MSSSIKPPRLHSRRAILKAGLAFPAASVFGGLSSQASAAVPLILISAVYAPLILKLFEDHSEKMRFEIQADLERELLLSRINAESRSFNRQVEAERELTLLQHGLMYEDRFDNGRRLVSISGQPIDDNYRARNDASLAITRGLAGVYRRGDPGGSHGQLNDVEAEVIPRAAARFGATPVPVGPREAVRTRDARDAAFSVIERESIDPDQFAPLYTRAINLTTQGQKSLSRQDRT